MIASMGRHPRPGCAAPPCGAAGRGTQCEGRRSTTPADTYGQPEAATLRRPQRAAYLFLLPSALILLVFVVYPIVQSRG